MPSAAFTTLGCKVNQYETQRILESFESAGFDIVPFDSSADVYVINSCSVTAIAEAKSRYTVRKARRSNPHAKVLVTGCAAQMALIKDEPVEGADLVIENPVKLETLSRFRASYPEMMPRAGSERSVGSVPAGRTRATLKIQDGCDVYCSYCSIPFTRPVMSSRPAEQVLAEAQRMAELGFREIVLTGVLIGAYGPQTGSGGLDFESLIEALQERLCGFTPMRLRISSIELRQVTNRLIALMTKPHPVSVVPHLHIPLQSGDDKVLEAMGRPYRRGDMIDLCRRLQATIPDLSITTDILVGFPTETEERFEQTLDLCRQVEYLKVHAFRFSPRPGTPADRYGDPIAPAVKQERSRRLGDLSANLATAHVRRFVGRTMRVLVEGKPCMDGTLEGLTDNYLTVRFAGPTSLARQFAWVRIHEERDGIAYGEVAADKRSVELAMVARS